MNLKAYFIIFSITVGALFFVGCEDLKFGNSFLDKPLSTDITLDTVFTSKKYADQALAEVYHSLPDFLPMDRFAWGVLESLTDIGDNVKDRNAYYTGQVNSTSPFPYSFVTNTGSTESAAMGPSYGIRKAWIYIENVDRVVDMTDEAKAIGKAEAKTIIAYHYADMLRYYGGMPWIDHAFGPNDDFKMLRLTVEEVVSKIGQLTEEVATVLPWSVSSEDDGRMTAAVALALNVRVRLFAASPLFNSAKPFMEGEASSAHYTWYGDFQESRWQDALDAGMKFLRENQKNQNFYRLVNTGDPREDFVNAYFTRYNREVLIASHRWAICGGNKAIQQIKFGISNPTGNYGDMFEWKTGEPFDWNNPEHSACPFFDKDGNPTRDIRMYETLMVNGDKWQGRKLEGYEGGREGWNSTDANFQKNAYNGYGMRKFQRDLSTERNGKPYQCPLLRLPEVYLSIAEAMNELGKAEGKDEFQRDAYDYVNLVRNRAGMPNLDKDKVTPGIKLREAILHERVVEFGFEEVRFFDINRWKRYDLLNVEYFGLLTKKEDNNFTYDRKTLRYDRIWLERWSDRYYLIPISQDEINKKYGLVQNPGW